MRRLDTTILISCADIKTSESFRIVIVVSNINTSSANNKAVSIAIPERSAETPPSSILKIQKNAPKPRGRPYCNNAVLHFSLLEVSSSIAELNVSRWSITTCPKIVRLSHAHRDAIYDRCDVSSAVSAAESSQPSTKVTPRLMRMLRA